LAWTSEPFLQTFCLFLWFDFECCFFADALVAFITFASHSLSQRIFLFVDNNRVTLTLPPLPWIGLRFLTELKRRKREISDC